MDGELNTYADVTDYGQIASGYIYAGVTPVIVNATTNTYEHHFKAVSTICASGTSIRTRNR